MKKVFLKVSLLLIILNIFNTLLGINLKPVYAATANNQPIINIESPTNNLSGVVTIQGYILSDYDPSTFGLMTSSVYIDGALDNSLGNLKTSISREDLKKKYPNYKYAGTGGFSYNLDTGKLSNGNHKIKFKFKEIEKEIVIFVKNNPPIINIESPTNNLSGIVTIQGYILSDYDPSIFGFMTSWVYIDGALAGSMGNLKTSVSREDLKKKYPNYKYAGTGGFSYKLDTGKLSNGNHKIKFKFNGIEKEIAISVKNNPSVINIESPTNNLSGVVTIQGCVLSDYDPSTFSFMNSHVYVDGALTDSLGNLKTSISREDLKKKYPDYKYAGTGGFSYELDTGKLSNGSHKVKFSFNGIEKEIVISVKNNLPIINIESPTNNLSGVVTIQGCVLSDYNPSTFGFMTSWVYIDGALDNSMFNLKTSISREDLKKKYPDYKYAGTGGFSYNLDTTKLSNGNHKIKFKFNEKLEKEIVISVKNNPPIINIESPTNTENLSGIVTIKGYVLSEYEHLDEKYSKTVYVDNGLNGSISNLISRDDIKKQYPNYKYAEKSGFSYDLDTTKLSNGKHKIKFDFNGIEKEITISTKNNKPIVNIESPINTENLSGVISIKGYILSEYNPDKIVLPGIYMDGEIYHTENYQKSIKREDLKKQYPDYKYAEFGGFSYDIDTRKLSNGKHKIKFNFNGIEKELDISVLNNQKSIINIESPNSLQNIGVNIKISGYVLSDFDPFNRGSASNVYLDGENYYEGKLEESIKREDLKKKYPNYKYAGTGGFSYNLDTTKLSNGSHKIKFNFNGIEKELDISVNNNNPPIINIESPVNMNNLTGIVTIKGYVLSNHKISFYNVFIDEKKCIVGNDLKTSIIREDLKSKYSNYKYAGTGGFSYSLDTTKLSNGKHKIKFSFNGVEKEIEIYTKNNPAIINIESPISTENLSGIVTIKGYILSEYDPSTFRFMTSWVYIDGALADSLGNLKTSISREDLKKQYPNYKYADTGGFSYNLDTTKLSNGKHKIKFNFNGVEKEIEIYTKNNPSIINIESPTNLENLSGVVTIQGCVLSDYDPSTFGFMTSSVYIDGALADSLFSLKTSISREDLKKKYPDYKYAGTGGFSYELDTVKLKNGKHKLKFDINGITKEIDISVNNYKQELVLDKIDSLKAQQGFMKLTGYIVSVYDTVSDFDYNIYIDDVKVNDYIFDFHCNLLREDLKDKYPYCKDVTKGGFKYILDTRTLKNGDHKIKIKFKDTESSIDFKVDNSDYNNSLDSSDDITFEEKMKRGFDEGFKQANEAIHQMIFGLNEMIEGINRANEGMAQMNEAINQINKTVVDMTSTVEAMNQMKEAINQINKTIVDMTSAINKSVEGMAQANEAINKMNAAVNQMNSGVDDINGFVSISIDILNDTNKALDKSNAEIAKLKLARNSGNARDIDWSGFDVKIKEYNDLSSKVNQSIMDKTMNYLADAIKHMIGGKYNDSINTLGIVGDFAIAFFGADLPADIRDLSHDIKYWQWSWGHAAETTLDAVGLVPVIGAIKYGDEVGLIVKDAEKGVETIKLKGGIKGAGKAKITIRLLDEVADANFLNIINKYKNKLPQWAIGKGNFGCAEVTIKSITKNEYFAHSAIQAEIESIKGTGISIKPDSTLLKAIKVDGNNVVDGAGAWLRDVDTEFKILSEIQNQLGTKYSTAGKIKLFTELECCPSCLDVIEQFKKLYPNIDIEVIYKIKK